MRLPQIMVNSPYMKLSSPRTEIPMLHVTVRLPKGAWAPQQDLVGLNTAQTLRIPIDLGMPRLYIPMTLSL